MRIGLPPVLESVGSRWNSRRQSTEAFYFVKIQPQPFM